MKIIKTAFFTLSVIAFSACQGGETKSSVETVPEHEQMSDEPDYLHVPADARVFFVNLQDGEEVHSPFTVEMGVEGMSLDPAGDLIEHSGHHHIIINGSAYPTGEVIPMNDKNLHYGDAQTEAELNLAPGEYTLTMQFANGHHQSYGEQMSAKVLIIVAE